MGRGFVFCSLILVLFLAIISVLLPGNLIFSLCSDSYYYLCFRTGLVIFLLLQLIMPPPRQAWFVALSIIFSALLIVWTIQLSITYKIQILDTLAFLEIGISVAIVSLEMSTVTFRQLIAANFYMANKIKDINGAMVIGLQYRVK